MDATRSDWTLTTWADGFGRWHCKVSSVIGWGNAGPYDIGRHVKAMRERARRAIRAEIAARQGCQDFPVALKVAGNQLDSMNVLHSLTFAEAGE